MSTSPEQAEQDKMMSAMFASMVMQNTNMALIFLGQQPNPQTGETALELEHARFFIDQLEMLAVKTRGNLDKQEEALLRQSLTHLRLAFVEAIEHPLKPEPASAESAAPVVPPVDEQEAPVVEPVLPGEKPAENATAESKTDETDSRKKFTKKY